MPKTVTRQRRRCDLNLGPSAPESSTLITGLPSHPGASVMQYMALTCSIERLTACGRARSGLSFKYSLNVAVMSAQNDTSVNMRLSLLVYSKPHTCCDTITTKHKTQMAATATSSRRDFLLVFHVSEHPPPRLASRRPLWSDMTPVNTVTQQRDDWSSASVVDHTTITDPTVRHPGFDLPRHTRSLMNRFRTGQGPCRANLHKWGLGQLPFSDCGHQQTVNPIVDTCPLTKKL